MPQARSRKLLPNIPWYLSFNLEGQSVPCGPSCACLFLGVSDFMGHLNLHPRYCHERFSTHCCDFIPPPLLSFLVETFYFHLHCPCKDEYFIFTSSWRSFSNSSAPSIRSLHFRNSFSLPSCMCIWYSSNLISCKSFASQYCFWYMYLFTDPTGTATCKID